MSERLGSHGMTSPLGCGQAPHCKEMSMPGRPSLIVAWEMTRRCVLACRHCRASATDRMCAGELSTAEGGRLIDAVADFATDALLIMTGGEPLSRPDTLELARRAAGRGLRVALATCGVGLTPDLVGSLKDAGVERISVSLDGSDATSHDEFRGVAGAFNAAVEALRTAQAGDLEFQVNTTVSKINAPELPRIHALAANLGAAVHDLFFLVPTGRGAGLRDYALSPAEQDQALEWALTASIVSGLRIKVTCAPQYVRIIPAHRNGAGCLAGKGFVFVSHVGTLQPCGFLDLGCGDLRSADFDFGSLYQNSPVFNRLRDPALLQGGCGSCQWRQECGGCRARAFAASGDYLGPDPSCPLAS